jgi:tryptophanyl-tRNA synthetase
MSKPRLLSGMQPTGLLHLGNLDGALANWVKLQDEYEAFYVIVDWHALTTLYDRAEEVKRYTREVAIDFLAAGLDPERCAIFVQSHVKEHAELHLLFSMITPVSWLERVPTYREKQAELKIASASYGLLGYPVLQAADILLYKANAVPVGQDQLPHLELAREIGRRFNYLYGTEPRSGRASVPDSDGGTEPRRYDIFLDCEAMLTEYAAMPGLDGRKMSKSYDNAIYIADSPEETIAKVRTMFTDPTKIHKTDPGHPEGCAVYNMQKAYGHTEMHDDCEAGRIGCVECKMRLATFLNDRLAPIRARRAELVAHPEQLDAILASGAEKARTVARETMGEVRRVMNLG